MSYTGIIAIDLGTTNCVASVIKENGEKEVILNHLGENITPSFIYIGDNNNILVGKPAIDKIETEPERVFHSYKPLMSTWRVLSQDPQLKKVTPEYCSYLMLKYLKTCAEQQTGIEIKKAVITVPAYFEEKQKHATKDSAERCKMEVIMLPTEPTSASYFFCNNVTERLPLTVLVYDLGGGTFDTCIQKIHSLKEVEVLAISGDKNLGGDDVNIAIAEYIAGDKYNSLTPTEKTILIKEANEAKILLSNAYHKGEEEIYKFKNFNKTLKVKDFIKVLKPLISRTISILDYMMQESKFSIENIDEVLLVGGSTRLPLIREMIVDLFGGEKFTLEYFDKYMSDPDLAVGYGANRLIKEVIDYGDDVINNILPIPIKLVSQGNNLDTIFKGNSMLPSRKVVNYTNSSTNQTYIDLIVTESFSNTYKEDETSILGKVRVDFPEPARFEGEYVFKIKFELSSNGLLSAKYTVYKDGIDKALFKNKEIPIIRKVGSSEENIPAESNGLNTSFGGM